MFILNDYLEKLITECKTEFGKKLLYVGLQGSYLRGEANENSDIDIMVVINGFSINDMNKYREILKNIGYYDKSCGFICGKEELAHWNPLEICHLIHTTKDLYGTLKELLPSSTRIDEINYVKLSLGNIYHEICHRYIHADKDTNISSFRATCKGLFFLIQNLHYLESGNFVTTKNALEKEVSESDIKVLKLSKLPDDFDFDEALSILFEWCQNAFIRIDKL